ncbi:MAG: hypothetical protein ACK5NC_11630 [Vibrio sp.]
MDKLTLSDYHDAVVAYLREKVPWLQSIDYYPETQTELPTPCAFFSVEDWEENSEEDLSDGTLCINFNCELIVVFGMLEPEYQKAIRNATVALGLIIHNCRFGKKIPAAVLQSAAPDAFDPDLDGYAVWSIKWSQRLYVGEIVISAEEFKPSKISVGYSPEIGSDNQDKYEKVTDEDDINP